MTTAQMLFLGLVFILVFGVFMGAMLLLTPNPVRQRLQEMIGASGQLAGPGEGQWIEKIVKAAKPIARLKLPERGWEDSALRIRFMNAGFRNTTAPILFFAAKIVFSVGLPLLFFLYVTVSGVAAKPQLVFIALMLLGAIGYYLPNGVLSHLTETRKREIFEAFPDALDLLTVCVEAGLALDAALQRVADEMRLKSAPLADELTLVTLELRAGNSKERALRNLALRTGVEDVDTLVAMLIQSERFGTSVADSLRVHADTLRTKRRLRAEEAAAKIVLKLLFPLIFCIFPTMLLVLLGPGFIQIYRILLPTLMGGH
jgi:tight adherence protein C